MKHLLNILLVVTLALMPVASSATSAAITYPHVQETITQTGYNAWLIENYTLPIVTIRLTFRKAGFAYDPKDKQGLSYLITRMLSQGAGDMDALKFKQMLETLAIDYDIDVDEDYLYISIRLLKENITPSLNIINIALTQPRFATEDLERIRKETLVALAKEKEDPDDIAIKAWNKLAFGNHPYGNEEKGTENTLPSITRDDLINYVSQHITKNNLLISVAGDITSDEVTSLLDSQLTLPENTEPLPDLPEFSGFEKALSRTIAHPTNQTIILFGQRGIKYEHPDYYTAHVLNYILGGGGFQSRLMNEIREKRGLAYTASTNLDPLEHAAMLQGYVATRNKEAKQTLSLVKQEIARLKKDGVTAEELKAAKDYLIGSYPLRMTSSQKLVSIMDFMQRHQLGSHFMERRNQLIEAVTQEDVNRVAKTLLEPDRLVTVTVGQ